MSIQNVSSGYSSASIYSDYNSGSPASTSGLMTASGDGISDTFDSSIAAQQHLEELHSQKDQAQGELGELHNRASDTQTQILSRKDEIIQQNQTEDPNDKQQAEYEEAKVELNEASEAKEQAQQELDQVTQDLAANKQERDANTQQNTQVSNDLSAARNELNSLTPPSQPSGDDPEAQAAYQAQLNDYNARKSEIESRINALQQQQQQLQSESQQLYTQNSALMSQQAHAQADIAQQSAVIQNAQSRIAEMQQAMSEGSQEMQDAMDQDSDLQALEQEYEELQQQAADKQAEIDQLDAEILASRDISELSQSERAERWTNDAESSDAAKLAEAMEAEGFDVEDEDGVIHINGTEGDDKIDITMGADGSYRVIVNGEESVYSAEEAKRLMIDSGDGDDKIRVHYDENTASFIDALPEGSQGNDTISAKAQFGRDYIQQNGGEGDDTQTVPSSSSVGIPAQNANSSRAQQRPQPAIFVNGGDGSDAIEADENVTAQMFVTGGNGDDQITGGSANNVIIDTQGNNSVTTQTSGKNTIITGDGSDVINARGGENVIYTQGGRDDITLGQQGQTGASCCNEVHSGDGDDIVTAHDGNNAVYGENGEDTIIAYKGQNDINGGADDDNITVIDGTNTVLGEDGDDVITAYNGQNTIYGGEGDEDITIYDGSSVVHGENGNDHIKAYKGDHAFYGENGNDKIEGGSGREYIEGGYGDDYIDGGAGGDVIYAGYGSDEVNGGDGDDFINAGGGDDIVHGNEGKDIIFGLSGDDELYGDGDEDTIVTGDGNDKVDGGGAADLIRYTDSGEHGHDTVLNADPSDDARALDPIQVPENFQTSNTMSYSIYHGHFPIMIEEIIEMPMEGNAAIAFENIINDNLEAFAAIEPGQALLQGIADTENTVTFEYYSEPNGSCRALDSIGLQPGYQALDHCYNEKPDGSFSPGTGCGSIVKINPAFIDFGVGSSEYANAQFAEQNTMLVIAHELCHAYNNATGTMDERYYNNYTGELDINNNYNPFVNSEYVIGAELQAVGLFDDSVLSANPYGMTENDYRDYFHMNPRDSYLPPKADEQ